MDRVDALLSELSARHHNQDPRFLTAVRPMVEGILDPRIREQDRVGLLELLAETFERDVQVRVDCERARVAWSEFLAAVARLLRGDRGSDRG